MLKTIARICQIAFFTLGVVVLLWFLGGKIAGERQRELPAFERALARRAVDRVVAELPRRDAVKRLLVLPVGGQDLDDRVTDLLVDRLEDERPEYDVIDARDYKGVVAPENVAAAIAAGRRLESEARPDGVLWSDVRRDDGRGGVGATVTLEARLVNLDPKAKFISEPVRATERIDSRFSVDWFSAYMEETSKFWLLVVWLVFTAGLPFALFPVVQAVTRRENNRLNGALLGGLVALDAIVAFVLLGLRPGLFGWLLVVLAAFAGLVYDFVICDRIDEMRK